MVHHITPAGADKNFGKAINTLIDPLPETDWICLRDIDTLPIEHVSFIQIVNKIVSNTDFRLIGCYTNRSGLRLQLHDGKLNDNPDINYHLGIAKDRANKYGNQVTQLIKTDNPEEHTIAGLMMLFPKKLWSEVGGFPEGTIYMNGEMIDYTFSQKCIKAGARIGLADGIYLFHMYRWGKNRKNKSHIF